MEPKCIRVLQELESAATDIVWESDGSLRLACANGTLVVLPTVVLPKDTEAENVPKKQVSVPVREPPAQKKAQEQGDGEPSTSKTSAPVIDIDNANGKTDDDTAPSATFGSEEENAPK
jgi:hypothetical protein